jgi:translation elongation factor P/translation initiation factor 5A
LYNLDLELDILVYKDGKNYIVIDEDDFECYSVKDQIFEQQMEDL